MRRIFLFLLTTLFCCAVFAQKTHKNTNKQAAIQSVQKQFNDLRTLSDKIWSYEETAFNEVKSSADLAAYATSKGFTVVKGIGGIPTAFTAEYGSGSPVIGILGEFDALPGLSQKTVPHKAPLNDGGAGHGCGHNLFGVASMGAATAIKELIEAGKLKGEHSSRRWTKAK